ncbi:hypothetical protein [Shewanella sp. Isolate11]|uniref:hypothetical protein n=1 Tax=Shewanella sp. Isolate11 TaxID=2908530 RepID=UPI001EFD939A|nr:hypothetical protein [Shewanella sp. Isolate11]MCG9697277.1 hypothetical protein [Shewanella sp. Isolate11]
MQSPSKTPKLLIIITACLYLPLFESGHAGTLWGLNWQSPAFMDQLSHYLRLIKLICVTVSIYLVMNQIEVIRHTLTNTFVRNGFIATSYIAALLQIPLLCLGIFWNGIFPSSSDYLHQEKAFEQRAIYVHTSDPGAMGKAYHHFYLKCPLAFNRYKLTYITQMDWMGLYDFYLSRNKLVIDNKDKNGSIHRIDLSPFNCQANS